MGYVSEGDKPHHNEYYDIDTQVANLDTQAKLLNIYKIFA